MYQLDELHKKYGMINVGTLYHRKLTESLSGPVVRLSPDEVHIKDSTWVDTLLAGPAQVSIISKQSYVILLRSLTNYREDGINIPQQPTKPVVTREVRY